MPKFFISYIFSTSSSLHRFFTALFAAHFHLYLLLDARSFACLFARLGRFVTQKWHYTLSSERRECQYYRIHNANFPLLFKTWNMLLCIGADETLLKITRRIPNVRKTDRQREWERELESATKKCQIFFILSIHNTYYCFLFLGISSSSSIDSNSTRKGNACNAYYKCGADAPWLTVICLLIQSLLFAYHARSMTLCLSPAIRYKCGRSWIKRQTFFGGWN